MKINYQGKKTGAVRFYLLASVLLHVILFLLVIWLLPGIIQKRQEMPGIIMTDLASPLPQKSFSKESLQAYQPDLHTKALPTTTPTVQTIPVQAAAQPSGTLLPIKRSEPSKETQTASTNGSNQTRPVSIVHQAATGQTPLFSKNETAGGRSQPQEMNFGSAYGPAFRKQAVPVYPPSAKRRGREGVVLLRLSISETGHLSQIEVLEDPGFGFAEAAQEAVRNSSFTPAHYNGKPIAIRATLPIRFTLR